VHNSEKHDEYGMLVRRYKAHIKHDVTLDSRVQISEAQIVRGTLRVLEQTLTARTALVDQGALHFVINGDKNGHVFAVAKLEFKNAHLHVSFTSLPTVARVANLDEERADFNLVKPLAVFGQEQGSLAQAILRSSDVGLSSDMQEWTLCAAKEIVGMPQVHWHNPPQGYTVTLERDAHRLFVKAVPAI
jgi:hypothetical protein